MNQKKKVIITGGTGSLGSALVHSWKDDYEVYILSRHDHAQQELRQATGLPQERFYLADICNYNALLRAFAGKDILVHTAALKIVDSGEAYPHEYHRVNTLGSMRVAQAWIATKDRPDPITSQVPVNPRKALYINSDKAIQATNLYGMTKAIGERSFVNHGLSSLRYGNVVESRGSFIHKWKAAIERGEPIELRMPSPTRFLLTMNEAVQLVSGVLDAIDTTGNGIFVPMNLPTFRVWDVATAMTGVQYAVGNMSIYQMASLRPGEKQHEILLSEGEAPGIAFSNYRVPFMMVDHNPGSRDYKSYTSANEENRLTGEQVLERLSKE